MWEPKFLDLKSLVKTQLKLNKSHGPFNDKLCALSFDPGTSLTETFLSAVLYLGHSASHSSTQRTLFPMTDNHQGWIRLMTSLIATAALSATYGIWVEWVRAALHWVDHLAPKPGISGLLLLALSPVAFLVVVFILRWIAKGFKAPTDGAVTD